MDSRSATLPWRHMERDLEGRHVSILRMPPTEGRPKSASGSRSPWGGFSLPPLELPDELDEPLPALREDVDAPDPLRRGDACHKLPRPELAQGPTDVREVHPKLLGDLGRGLRAIEREEDPATVLCACDEAVLLPHQISARAKIISNLLPRYYQKVTRDVLPEMRG